MTIRQYHQHHPLRDEEDLFHSTLSNEFDDHYHSLTHSNNRPWGRPRRDDREPYELLDDVPPADLYSATAAASVPVTNMQRPQFPNQHQLPRNETQLFPDLLAQPSTVDMSRAATEVMDNRSAIRRFESELRHDVFPDGLLGDEIMDESIRVENERDGVIPSPLKTEQPSRYPIDELYPTESPDVIMDEANDKDEEIEYDFGTDDDYYSHMQYSEPLSSVGRVGPSRYPIDDVEEESAHREGYESKYQEKTAAVPGRQVIAQLESLQRIVSPAASDDGELDTYQPMHLYNSSKSKYYEDNDEQQAISLCSNDSKSNGTFDLLYEEEYTGISSNMSVNKSGNHTSSPVEEEGNLSSLLPKLTSDHSPDSVVDTPSSNGSFLGDLLYVSRQEEDGNISQDLTGGLSPNNNGQTDMVTPLRSNQNAAAAEVGEGTRDTSEVSLNVKSGSTAVKEQVQEEVSVQQQVDVPMEDDVHVPHVELSKFKSPKTQSPKTHTPNAEAIKTESPKTISLTITEEMENNVYVQVTDAPKAESMADEEVYVPFVEMSKSPKPTSPQQDGTQLNQEKHSETPQTHGESPRTRTTCNSPSFDSNESAIQDLARIMQEQQRQHRVEKREVHQVTQHQHEAPQGRKMSRLEEWQQKLKERRERQKAACNYIPAKYHANNNAGPMRKSQMDAPQLEPTDVEAKDPEGVRYYGDEGEADLFPNMDLDAQSEANLFPNMEWDEQGRVTQGPNPNQRRSIDAAPSDIHPNANLSGVSSATERMRHAATSPVSVSEYEARESYTFDQKQVHLSGPHHRVPDELSMVGSYNEQSSVEYFVNKGHSMNDEVSVISVDTELRRLAEQVPVKTKSQHEEANNPYSIKAKDSMESDMKLDIDYVEQLSNHAYNLVVKRTDSMEQDMVIDFEEEYMPVSKKVDDYRMDDGGVSIVDYYQGNKSPTNVSVASPPIMRRQQFVFDEIIEEEEENDVVAELASYSDESESTNDPTVFPTKAVYQMKLSRHSINNEGCESNDLIERACEYLARGMNEEALDTLNEALQLAQTSLEDIKESMNDHYHKKEKGLEPPTSEQSLEHEEEYEEKLDSEFREIASEMADIINNIGVVHELNGNLALASNAFRDALDVYRRMCHRYENSGDADVDRAVSNIMHMGIAMRSIEKREELHSEEEELDAMIKASNNAEERKELRIERLNVLMAVLEIENESLGRTHPTVGFTLLKKGQLHLQMNHIDLAVNDVKGAVDILKGGLGPIHPAVGSAQLFLADIFNYQGLNDPVTDKNTALSLYKESLVAFSESYSDSNENLGLAHNSIGIIYTTKGEIELAMTSFYNALAGYGVRARGTDPSKCQAHPDVAFVWINVGDLHMENKEWQLALRSYLKALSALRSMDKDDRNTLHRIGPKRLARNVLSRSPQSQTDDSEVLLAFVLQNIAKAESMLQKYGKSIEILEEALRIHRIIDMRCKDAGRVNNWSKEIARILENLGEVQFASGNITSAFNCYVESLSRLRSNGECNNNGIEVALVLGAIGQVHLKKGEYGEATVILKECLRSFETVGVPQNNRRYREVRSTLIDAELALMQNSTSTLAAQRREISEVQYQDRALACDEIADAYKNKDDSTSAVWFYSEALSLRREKVQQVTGSLRDSYFVDIGKTISNIAEIRHRRREFEAAKILLDEAKQFYKSVGLSEQHPFYRDLTDKIEALRKS